MINKSKTNTEETQLDEMLKFGNTRKEIVKRAKELIKEGKQSAISDELEFLEEKILQYQYHLPNLIKNVEERISKLKEQKDEK